MAKSNFGITQRGARRTKSFNEKIRFVQGIRTPITGSTITSATIQLQAAGMFLLGIAVFPVTGLLTTLADTNVKFVVNNLNLLLSVGANNLNPNFVEGMMFYPTPQPLSGTDSITIEFNKQDAGNTTVYTNVYYIPQPAKKNS
jgi:hypothetical protein